MQSNGRDASGGGIRHKLGSLFSPRGPPPAARGREEAGQSTFITADVLRELEAEQCVPTQRRVRAMKELSEIVTTKRLEEYAVQTIWKSVRDLLQPQQPPDVRQAVLHFTRSLVVGQYSELGMMRAQFFKVIQTHRIEEDAQQRLDLLLALTQGGKDIQYFEEAIGSFLVEWMPEATTHTCMEDCLGLLVKLVHYNSAYLEEDVLTFLVSHTCSHANQTTNPTETELCLAFLDAVICYSAFPPSTVHPCVITLCHTLNIERFIQLSLEVMQRLLGTHLGRTVIYTMCSVLQDKFQSGNVLLLRGAVFYISMSLWGVKRVENLGLPFTAVLPAIHQASESGHTIVVYEVALSVLRLVRHYAPNLEDREWEIVHRILHSTQQHLIQAQQALPGSSPAQLQATLQEIFSSIELYWEGGWNAIGPAHLFFQLLDGVRDTLPVQSVLSLVHYTTLVIDSADQDWIQKLSDFMDKFYRCERRSEVRKAALAYLGKVLDDHWLTQEGPLLQHILLPYFKPLPLDTDSDLRCQAVQLLVYLLPSSSTGHTLSLLALLSQVLKKGLQEAEQSDPRLPDCKAAVFGLTQLLKEALYRPSPLAEQVFSVLVAFLQQLYAGNCFTATSCVLRINIFNCLLRLRADKMGQLGYFDDDSPELKYSPFTVCTVDGGQRSMAFSCTVLHLRGVFDAVQACLYKDVEWEAVFQLMHLLKETLQCRTLTLSAMPDLSLLIPPLCSLAECHSARLDLFNTAPNPAEIASSVYPLLAVLATYPGHLDRRAQHDLVCCLEAGLLRKEPEICTTALIVCSLELQATMTRFLPRVLYRLAQVAATPSMATPTLEFLAGLIPIPALVSGFMEEEYLSVFGIALPYTNSARYSSYVVAMAHHMISMWFLRCRLRYRPRVARLISKSLSTHMVVAGVGEEGAGPEKVQLCQDLIETTLDMLARYTYSNISSLPSRSSGAEFLVSGGPSKTWALSNYLVTVTTTGEAGGEPGTCAQCVAELRANRPHAPSMAEDKSLYNIATATGRSPLCSCWCWGWAEVKVRRPSGNIAWMLRLENRLQREHAVERGEGELAAVAAAYNYPFEIEETDQERCLQEHGHGRQLEDIGRLGGQLVEREGNSEEQKNGEDELSWQETLLLWQPVAKEGGPHHQPPVSSSPLPVEGCGPVTEPCAIERMPPLLSYETTEPAGRSPSLHGSLLTEQEQLTLVARAGRTSESSVKSDDELTTTTCEEREKCGHLGLRGDGKAGLRGEDDLRGEAGRGEGGKAGLRGEDGEAGLKGEDDLRGEAGREEGGEAGLRGEGGEAGLRGEDSGVQSNMKECLSLPVEPLSQPDCSSTPQQSAPDLSTLSPSMTSHRRIAFQKVPVSGGGSSEDMELPNDPSFVFLQLFHSAALSLPPAPHHTPLLLAADEATTRAVKLLDHIPPYNTHKIGVVYVGKGQTSEAAILANTSGSSCFQEFLSGLGQLLRLADCQPDMVYLGGLDQAGSDGEYTYIYQDDTTQVVFHVATLMPTLTSDPQCSNKKLHIGNDFVTIVYNESGLPYQFGTMKGQFCYAEVVVEPLPEAVNRVCVRVRPGMEEMLSLQPSLCSSVQLPILARTKALQANFASLIHVSESPSLAEHHPSNWLDRLRQIRRIRARCTADSTFPDFTSYS